MDPRLLCVSVDKSAARCRSCCRSGGRSRDMTSAYPYSFSGIYTNRPVKRINKRNVPSSVWHLPYSVNTPASCKCRAE